jgi:hypothetical protein
VTPSTVGDGKHLRFRVRQARARRRERDRVRTGVAARPPSSRRPLRRRVPAQGEPLERHGRAAARRPPDLRHGRRLRGAPDASRRSLATGRVGLDAGGAARVHGARSHEDASVRRQLLESESFRALLLEREMPRAA